MEFLVIALGIYNVLLLFCFCREFQWAFVITEVDILYRNQYFFTTLTLKTVSLSFFGATISFRALMKFHNGAVLTLIFNAGKSYIVELVRGFPSFTSTAPLLAGSRSISWVFHSIKTSKQEKLPRFKIKWDSWQSTN